VKVINTIDEYPDEGLPQKSRQLTVSNHWNLADRVVFTVDGDDYTYLVSELIAAINNASNHKQ